MFLNLVANGVHACGAFKFILINFVYYYTNERKIIQFFVLLFTV